MWQNTCCKTKQIEPKPNIWSQLENTSPSAYQNNLFQNGNFFLPFCTFDFPQGYQICWFAWFSGGELLFWLYQADFYLPVYMHMNFFKKLTFNGLHIHYATIPGNYIWCMSTMNLFCKKDPLASSEMSLHIFSFKRKFKDGIG